MRPLIGCAGQVSIPPDPAKGDIFRQVALAFNNTNGVCAGYGVVPKRTLGNGFTSLWGEQVIFHDVFEHWHEFVHPWFEDQHAANISGEMFAMGALWWYYHGLGFSGRLGSQPSEPYVIRTTLGLIASGFAGDYRFGSALESRVPPQDECDCGLENLLDKYGNALEQVRSSRCKEETVAQARFNQSVTMERIRDLHRAGYRQAREDVPDTAENRETLKEFYSFWARFCRDHAAGRLYGRFKEIIFRLYHRGDDRGLGWDAIFVSAHQTEYPDALVSLSRTELTPCR